MKCLFVFAHPDDETVGAGGFIRLLHEQDDFVHVISATDGSTGKIDAHALDSLTTYGSVGALRKEEFRQACSHLGVNSHEILDFQDGFITNEIVWGELTSHIRAKIETHKPQVVVTFDHTGWYYHLDHIAVSIATTRAVKESAHTVELLLFTHYRSPSLSTHFGFIQADHPDITHSIDIKPVVKHKIMALKAHASQNLSSITERITKDESYEYIQVAQSTPAGEQILNSNLEFLRKC
jgi:LmbE family N-acetylglucosaminyl deacetylase